MLIAASYGTVEDIEIFWVAISLIGFIFSCFGSLDAWKDYQFLRDNGVTNGRILIAKGLIVSELGRAYIQLVFCIIGTAAMFLPNAPFDVVDIRALVGIFIRWGLLTCAIVIMIKSIYAWHVRQENMKELRKMVDGRGKGI